jgi:hypothetical protein
LVHFIYLGLQRSDLFISLSKVKVLLSDNITRPALESVQFLCMSIILVFQFANLSTQCFKFRPFVHLGNEEFVPALREQGMQHTADIGS